MDFLKSMKLRKKSNSKDTAKNKNKQENSTKVKKKGLDKKQSLRSVKTKKKGKTAGKSKREKKSCPSNDNANLAINIFDQDTFTFRIETCVHPEPTNHSFVQTQAYESFAAINVLFLQSILSSGVEGLIKEYTEVLVPFIPVGYYERTIFDQNTPLKKNRYKDVVCNDKTRVILNDGRSGDYIHANYLKGTKPLYILTQGPIKDSQIDMWRMVLQEGVAAICMLCELTENGRPKCEPYFPETEGQVLTFNEITVTCTEYTLPDVHTQLKALTVLDRKTGKTHKLSHYKIVTCVLRTHRILRKLNGPVVVHCSAGVGRTGTFAAIEVGVQCLLNGKSFRPVDLVKAMRHCRLQSVQMDTQYLMLVEAILDMGVAFKYIEDAKLLEAIETYKRQTADYVEAHPPPLEPFKALAKKEKDSSTNKDTEEGQSSTPQVQSPNPAPTNTIYPLLSNPIGPPPANPPPPPAPAPPVAPSPAPAPSPAQPVKVVASPGARSPSPGGPPQAQQVPPVPAPAPKVSNTNLAPKPAPVFIAPAPAPVAPGAPPGGQPGQSVHMSVLGQPQPTNVNLGNSQYL
ncbi:hypothetical protein CAEBREN_32118 [Caenorhabditis brenneri]|uniref:Uncharacterized protein n=1 Tax=Caenorhabditis brenneri TaxID=135651 RepID=G0NCE7_CAEBE|nr:hypothetical protein CAEBREN_32118 [Caenorhabditis brenneri]